MAEKSVLLKNTVFPRYVWENLENGDTAEIVSSPQQLPLAGSIQVTGTFGGATASVEASHDGDNWFPLVGLTSAEIGLEEPGLVEFSSSALYFRPKLTGGGGSTDIVVSMVFRGNHAL